MFSGASGDGRFTASPVRQVGRELLEFLSSRVPDGQSLTVETDLLEAEVLDSLLIMDLAAHVERTYGVKLENTDIAPRHFRSVAALAELVAERMS